MVRGPFFRRPTLLAIFALLIATCVALPGPGSPQSPERPGPSAVVRLEISPQETIDEAALSPDGSLLCLGSSIGELTVWQTKDGRLNRQFRSETGPERPRKLFDPIVLPDRDPSFRRWPPYAMTFDSTGQTVAFPTKWGLQDLTPKNAMSMTIDAIGSVIEVWDVNDGRKVASLDIDKVGPIQALGFEPPGGRLVTIDWASRATTWDVAAGRKVAQFGSNQHEDVTSAGAHEATLSGDATRAASVVAYEGDPQPPRHLRLWDLQARTLRLVAEETLLGPDANFGAVVLSPDGRQVAAAVNDSTIRLIDFAAARQTGKLTTDKSFSQARLAFGPDARQLVAFNRDGQVRVYDVASQALVWSAKSEAGAVLALHWSNDRLLVVSRGLQREPEIEPITLTTYAIPHP